MDIDTLRHSVSHIMAQAVKELFPHTKLAIGPSIEDGFYYDFDTDRTFSQEDLAKIEEKMRDIAKQNLAFERQELKKQDALALFKDLKEDYKIELINEIPDEVVSVYKQGKFIDLCRGPHIAMTSEAKVFKLLSSCGAYWRGDEHNKMLQRIYGTAFFSQKELDQHLFLLEETKKRDHRKLGKELDLFSIQDEIGPGLVLWHPRGAVIRRVIEDFWKDEHVKKGYKLIYTPHIARQDLWSRSGHLEFYKDYMYSPMDIEGKKFLIKPMNCPSHILIYKSQLRSYKELPLRFAELGTVYRYEKSGVLHGLMRVRGFTQDDAHIFLTEDQLEQEILSIIEFVIFMLRTFGFTEYEIFISTRPEKFVGTLNNWEKAERALKGALDNAPAKLHYTIDPGEGVFYGPKIDIKIKDVLGRPWQCTTIQVDFNLPERFDVTYIGEDGKEHRPIMVHRALLGSFERFFGVLIEHYAGAFPLWLAPVQAVIIPISQKQHAYALEVKEKFEREAVRVELDTRNERMEYKIREAQVYKIPYMVIMGEREVSKGMVSVRSRQKQDEGPCAVEALIMRMKQEIESKV
ncbi:MAG: threonine--tRNA ligase [Candidatus Omnitrophota bacterium]